MSRNNPLSFPAGEGSGGRECWLPVIFGSHRRSWRGANSPPTHPLATPRPGESGGTAVKVTRLRTTRPRCLEWNDFQRSHDEAAKRDRVDPARPVRPWRIVGVYYLLFSIWMAAHPLYDSQAWRIRVYERFALTLLDGLVWVGSIISLWRMGPFVKGPSSGPIHSEK